MFFFIVLVVLLLIYSWFQNRFKYWDKRGVRSVPGKIPLGSIGGMGTTMHSCDLMKRMYDEHKGKGPGVGLYMFAQPGFLITEPDLVKEVLVKNFESFDSRGIYFNDEVDPLSKNLFFTRGQYWKDLRVKLSPTFTSGKIKFMFETVSKVCDGMINFMEPLASKSGEIEVKEILSAFTTEVITSVALGVETKCLGNPDNKFKKAAEMLSSKMDDRKILVHELFSEALFEIRLESTSKGNDRVLHWSY